MDWLCCETGYAFFDVWALVHLSFWVFVGSTLWAFKANKWASCLVCLGLALSWELFEYIVAFPRWPDRWLDPESIWNALGSDLLTCLIGVLGIWWLLDRRMRRVI